MLTKLFIHRLVLGGCLISFMCLCIGCASAASKGMVYSDTNGLSQREPVVFPQDYKGGPVSSNPVNWKDYYDTASYHFRQGNYEQACLLYQKASELTGNEEVRLTSLTAAALSALGANNEVLFRDIRERVTQSVQGNMYRETTITDRYIRILNTVTFN